MDARQKAIAEALNFAADALEVLEINAPEKYSRCISDLRALAAAIEGGQEAWHPNDAPMRLAIYGPFVDKATWRRVLVIELPEEK